MLKLWPLFPHLRTKFGSVICRPISLLSFQAFCPTHIYECLLDKTLKRTDQGYACGNALEFIYMQTLGYLWISSYLRYNNNSIRNIIEKVYSQGLFQVCPSLLLKIYSHGFVALKFFMILFFMKRPWHCTPVLPSDVNGSQRHKQDSCLL